MYGYIQRACYFRLIIDLQSFNKILKDCRDNKKYEAKEVVEIKLNLTEKCKSAISADNEFVRIVHKDWYADVSIKKVIIKEKIILQLGKILDSNAKIKHTNT
jgi:hypothetical protein